MSSEYTQEQIKILKDLMNAAAIAPISEKDNAVKILKETAEGFKK
jgi:hypothetical protein